MATYTSAAGTNFLLQKLFTATLLVSLLFPFIANAALFEVLNPATSKPCIMVEANFTLELTAVHGDTTVGYRTFTSDDPGIQVQGSCGQVSAAVMTLFFSNSSANWLLKFSKNDTTDEVSLDRLVQFSPRKVFGGHVTNSSDLVLMDDPGTTDVGGDENSYLCDEYTVTDYFLKTGGDPDTNYTAASTVFRIHAQAFNINGGNFSKPITCEEIHTTPSSPNTTTPITISTPSSENTTALPPTLPPSPVQEFIISDGNITCIVFEAEITLNIEYEIPDKKTKVARIPIPAGAAAFGSCHESKSTQKLTISFYKDWSLTYIFSDTKANIQESLMSQFSSEKHPSYRISNITLVAVVDKDHFPDAVAKPGTVLEFNTDSADALPRVASNKGFYQCKSSVKTTLESKTKVETSKLKFRAFGEDSSSEFSGKPDRCSADDSGDNNTLIIVLCVLAAIVLIIIVVVIVMCLFKRKRQAYNNI